MNDQEFELVLERLMGQDLSAGTEDFRDALLARCLSVLCADDEGAIVDDDVLDLLAAAGDAFAFDPYARGFRDDISDNADGSPLA